MPTMHRTIVRPLITEKSSAAYQERAEYTFVVHPTANKTEIKQAIERLFGVTVTGVWTSQQRGKLRKVGQNYGNRPNWKKAIVTLKSGDTIPIFEG
jgi:large subunit ribosomal protein L23